MSRTSASAAYAFDLPSQTADAGRTSKFSTLLPQSVADQAFVDKYFGREREVTPSRKQTEEIFAPVPELRPVPASKTSSFTSFQEWEGSVDSIGISHFEAHLSETKAGGEHLNVAEIPIGDIAREQRDNLKVGAVFRYLLGYAQDERGIVTKKRLVYFRKGRSRSDLQKTEDRWLRLGALFSDDVFTRISSES